MEVKLIVDNAIEEMKSKGLDDSAIQKAITYWSEISGIDIKSINENTPFDIDIVNKLLSTFPNVMSKISDFKEEIIEIPEFSIEEFKSEDVSEDLEKELEMLMNILSSPEEVEEVEKIKSVDENLEKELRELAFSLAEEEPKAKISDIKSVRMAIILSNGKVEKFMISKETDYKPNISKLIETISNLWSILGLDLNGFDSFHLKLKDLTLYIQKRENKIYVVLVETETVGGAKFFIYGLERA
jgi:hypothetical protein